jgi:hypothetical protein
MLIFTNRFTTTFLFLNLPIKTVSPTFTGMVISSLIVGNLRFGIFFVLRACSLSSYRKSIESKEYPTKPATLVICSTI